MKTLLLSLVSGFAFLTSVLADPPVAQLATSLNGYHTIYASSVAPLDSNIDTGGGTDCTAKIQSVLNTASATNPLHLVWDRIGLTSATLVVRSFTDLEFLPGAGIFLAPGSNCTAISNRVSGSAIADVNITIRGPFVINCNGNNQSVYQGGVSLDSYTATSGVTNGTTAITYAADPGYGADNHRVAIGQAITGTDIPANTVIASIQSATQATISNAATGSHTGLSFSLVGGFADRITAWNYGLWFAGFKGVHIRDGTIRNSPSFGLLFTNGSDFEVRSIRTLWDDNIGPQTLGTGVTNGTGTVTYAPDPNFGAPNAYVRSGGYISGTNIPTGTFVGSVLSSTSCTLIDGSGNPVNASGSGTGITFTFLPTTNFSRDGVHLLGNTSDGHIEDFWTNGDGDAIALNTDEGANMGDTRRGNGGAISHIDVENVRLKNATNTYRLYGANGIGTLDAITFRNWSGNIIQGFPGCSPATVGGTHYYGRVFGDEALASVGSITLEGWFPSAAGGTNTANVNPKILNSTNLIFDIPAGLAPIFTGCVIGQRLPPQDNATNQQLGTPFNAVATESSAFTIGVADRGKIFNVTTGSGAVGATFPAPATAGNGFSATLRKHDNGTGYVAASFGPRLWSQGDVMLCWTDGTTWYSQLFTGSVDNTPQFHLTVPSQVSTTSTTTETLRLDLNNTSAYIQTWYASGTKLGDVHPVAGLEFANITASNTLTSGASGQFAMTNGQLGANAATSIRFGNQTGTPTDLIEIWNSGGGARLGYFDDRGGGVLNWPTIQLTSKLQFTPGSAPDAPTEGTIYADSTDHHLYFWNGSAWKQLDN